MAYTIDSLKFSNRLKNALRKNECFYVDQLLALKEDEINSIRGLGKITIDEIFDFQTKYAKFGEAYIESMIDDNKHAIGNVEDESVSIIEVASGNKLGENDRVLFKNKDGRFVEDFPITESSLSQGVFDALRRAGCFTVRAVAFKNYKELESERGFGQKKMSAVLDYFSPANIKVSINHFESRERTEEIYSKLANSLAESEDGFNINAVRTVLYNLIDENYDELVEVLNKNDCYEWDELVEKTIWKSQEFIDSYKVYITDLISKYGRISFEKDRKKFPKLLTNLGITLDVVVALCLEGVIERDSEGETTYRIVKPDIETWLKTLKENHRIIINLRLEGKTLEKCGEEVNLTRERVRQIIEKVFNRRPSLREDDYQYWYEKYGLSEDAFCYIFSVKARIYQYLELAYKQGQDNYEEMISDTNLTEQQQERLNSYLNKDKILVDDEYVVCTREAICRRLAEKYYADISVNYEDFYLRYKQLLEENGLENNSRLLCPTENSLRAFKARLEDCDYILCKTGSLMRYYPIFDCDAERLVNELNLEKYENEEISSLELFVEHRDLMKEYDIRDEYELHNLLKKTSNRWQNMGVNMAFGRMPTLIIGGKETPVHAETLTVLDMLDDDFVNEEIPVYTESLFEEKTATKKFYITIEETVCETFEVIAEDENQAREIAAAKYESGEFVLEPGELQNSKMKVSNESYETLIDWEEI